MSEYNSISAATSTSGSTVTISSQGTSINFTSKIDVTKESIEKLEQHIDQLEEDIDFFNQHRIQQEDEIDNLRTKVAQQETDIAFLKGREVWFTSYTNYLEDRIRSLEDKIK